MLVNNTYTIDRIEEGYVIAINDETGETLSFYNDAIARLFQEGMKFVVDNNFNISIIDNVDEKKRVEAMFQRLQKRESNE